MKLLFPFLPGELARELGFSFDELAEAAPTRKRATSAPKYRHPEGARARPPEDVGGPWSYTDFLKTIRDPNHEDHSSILRWAGGHFDPDCFDIELINKDLRNAFRKNTSRRLHQPKPKPSAR